MAKQTWIDRLAGSIKLVSPSGVSFECAWSGDKRTLDKKLGVFEYPKARGAVVQDLDVGAVKYPLTLFFEGPDHDLTAAQFFRACSERGPWVVTHPIHGALTLQLVSVVEENQPVTSGNITQVGTEWIEPGVDLPVSSAAQLAADVRDQINKVQAAASDQFVNKVVVSKPTLLGRLVAGVAKFLALVNAAKAAIARINAIITAIRTAIISTITSVVSGIASLAGAIQALILLPGMIIKDIKSRFDYFGKILSAAVGLNPKTPSAGGVNEVALHELVASTCLVGMAQTLVDAEFRTREEALGYMDAINAAFTEATRNLDAAQTLYANSPIDRQVFSQSESYNDLLRLIQLVSSLMLRRSFDLATAKRVTLAKDRAPIEIALTEGIDLDLFISSNKLKGNDILLLPAGRQVVVYL